MPTDPTGASGADPTRTESDTPMFAPIRTSERGKKTSFFSAQESATARADEPRSFAETPAAATPATGERMDTVDPSTSAFATGPTFAGGRTTARNRNMAPMAIAGGLVLLAGVAAAGWYYYSQSNAPGMAQLTPGGGPAATAPVAPPVNELAQAPAPTPTPATEAAPPKATAKAAAPPRPLRAAHARAASRSVEDQGVNASAVTPAPAPTTVSPPVNPTPPQAAPAPAPTPVTPPPSDTTPAPTQTAPPPAPQQTPPTPPTQPPN